MESVDNKHVKQSLIVWAVSFVVIYMMLHVSHHKVFVTVDKDGKEVVQRNKVMAYSLLLSSIVTLIYFMMITRKKEEAQAPLSMRMFGRRKMRMGGCGCSK
jgi:hypothetical protein